MAANVIELSYRAELGQLEKALSKVQGMNEGLAKKMVNDLDKSFRATEAQSKRLQRQMKLTGDGLQSLKANAKNAFGGIVNDIDDVVGGLAQIAEAGGPVGLVVAGIAVALTGGAAAALLLTTQAEEALKTIDKLADQKVVETVDPALAAKVHETSQNMEVLWFQTQRLVAIIGAQLAPAVDLGTEAIAGMAMELTDSLQAAQNWYADGNRLLGLIDQFDDSFLGWSEAIEQQSAALHKSNIGLAEQKILVEQINNAIEAHLEKLEKQRAAAEKWQKESTAALKTTDDMVDSFLDLAAASQAITSNDPFEQLRLSFQKADDDILEGLAKINDLFVKGLINQETLATVNAAAQDARDAKREEFLRAQSDLVIELADKEAARKQLHWDAELERSEAAFELAQEEQLRIKAIHEERFQLEQDYLKDAKAQTIESTAQTLQTIGDFWSDYFAERSRNDDYVTWREARNRRTATMLVFRAQQGLAIAQAIMNTAAAITQGIAMFGPPPSPGGIAAIASAAAIGTAQTAIIATQKPPKMHMGGQAGLGRGPTQPDEQNIRITKNERVDIVPSTHQGAQGDQMMPRSVTLRVGGRDLVGVIAEAPPLKKAIATGRRDRVGHSNRHRGR